MTAILLVLCVFAVWWLVGVASLVAIRADVSNLRIALVAPAIGSAVVLIPLFVASHAGAGMSNAAPPIVVTLVILSVILIAVRRPRLPVLLVPVLVLCLLDVYLVGRPFFDFGFDWIANANDDMANYVLGATDLLHHGLNARPDLIGLAKDRDYPSVIRSLNRAGARPGAEIALSAFSGVAGRPPYELFMPLIVAFSLVGVCGVAGLAMQASRRWFVPILAAAIFVASPLAASGTLQQLMPQVWGLALAAALLSLLMRAELHGPPGPRPPDVVLITLLVVAFVVVYVELAATIAAAYALFVALLLMRRRLATRSLILLWWAPLAATLVFLNTYFFRELHFLASQTKAGAASTLTAASGWLFGYTLAPAELAAIAGLQIQAPSPTTRFLGLSIAVALVLLAAATVAALATFWRGVGASCVLVVYLGLGLYLGAKSAAFGIFKLAMYVQPFLAAAVAIWLGGIRRRWVLTLGLLSLVAILVVQVHTVDRYVRDSRDPIDLPHASAADLLPTFRHWVESSDEPIVAVTENPPLAKLEAATAGQRPLYFISRYLFPNKTGWAALSISTRSSRPPTIDSFLENTAADGILASGHCVLVLPTGSQTILNRRTLPEGSPDLVERQCGKGVRNLLVFTSSSQGQGFYLPAYARRVSFYQLEHDYFYPGHTMSGFGRLALFRVLGPSATVRLELDVTASFGPSTTHQVPPAAVIGSSRVSLPIVGRGSAQVFSPPLEPEMIDGQPFLLLEMGGPAEYPKVRRSGIEALYGSSIVLDPRYLTSYVRDISLVSNRQYETMQRPTAITSFPAGLANPNLEYSGIYEDGWAAGDSYVVLRGGKATTLSMRANALPIAGQRLQVSVNGRVVASRAVPPGLLDLHVRLPATSGTRRIEFRWARATKLGPRDQRQASALLRFIGIGRPR